MNPLIRTVWRQFVGGPLDGSMRLLRASLEQFQTSAGPYHLRAGKMYFRALLPSDWKPRRWRPKENP